MTALKIIYALLGLLSGMGVFLYGMKLMSDSLENVAGNSIKSMFSKISDNKLIGVGIGAGTTAVIQSSAAVTVMLIGFVNSHLMSLTQATTIIYGANIGTTITAQIVALGYGGISNLNLTVIIAACAGIGAFMIMFAKKDKVKKVGGIITGLGMIFVGLSVMSSSMEVFSQSEEIKTVVASLDNRFLLLFFGILFTALIQSSSAVSGLVITMAFTGILDFEQSMYIIVGSNVGTCITAILSAIGTSVNARRVAIIHLLFNVFGVILFLLSDLFIDYATIFPSLFATPQLQIAMLHTYFNIMTVVILLPITNILVKLSQKIIKDNPVDNKDEAPHFYYLEPHLLRTPPLAMVQLKNEVINMAGLSKANFDMALEAIITGDLSKKSLMEKNETIINFLNREIAKFLVNLSHADISYDDKIIIGTTYHTISDIERIGDYSENMLGYAVKMKADNLHFSDEAMQEVNSLKTAIKELFNVVMDIYKKEDITRLPEANVYEDTVDNLKLVMGQKHIERLNSGACTPELGAIYLSLASNSERVADHIINIALSVRTYAKQPQKTVKK